MQTFKERAKQMDYSNTYYPYADKGPKKMRVIQNVLVSAFVLGLLGGAGNIGGSYLETIGKQEQAQQKAALAQQAQTQNQASVDGTTVNGANGGTVTADNPDTHIAGQEAQSASDHNAVNENYDLLLDDVAATDGRTVDGGSSSASIADTAGFSISDLAGDLTAFAAGTGNINWKSGVGAFFKVFGSFMVRVAWMLIFVDIILFMLYLVNVTKRSREYERNIIGNDMKAVALYRSIQGSLKISQRLKEAKRAAYPKKSDVPPSADALSKVEELQYMKKMDVRVNTRQKLQGDKINTIYSIIMPLPIDETTSQNLLKRVEHLNDTITRLAKGQVTIGGYLTTEDRQQIIFQGETPDLEDPYNFEARLARVAKSNVVEEKYESAYKITNFVDRQPDIDKKKELAGEWAKQTGTMLDRYLITAKMKVTRLDTNVSSSKATYTYDLALDANLSSGFNKFDEALDKAFKLKGSAVSLAGGKLEIILPIPKEYHIPINVPTLYREAFGEGAT